MEPRSQLRRYTRSSNRLSTDNYQHNSPRADSSDEDDDDGIPASKLPSVSPLKRPSTSSARTSANQNKRSHSDTAQGGIILYPGSKRQRIGYNMPSVAREPLQNSTLNSLRTPMAAIQTPARTESLSLSPEYDVPEGLVTRMNDALRRQPTYRTQDCIETRLYQAGAVTSPLLGTIESVDPEEDRASIDDDGFALPSAVLNDTNEQPSQSAYIKPASIDAGLNGEDRDEMSVRLQVDNALLSAGNPWDVPDSPAQLSAQQEPPDSSSQMPPLAKKRDNDYITRIAALRKKPVPPMLDSNDPVPQQSSLASNATSLIQLIGTSQLGQTSQGDGADISTQGQVLNASPQPCVDSNVESGEDGAQPINEEEPDVGDYNDEQNRDSRRDDDDFAQNEAMEPGNPANADECESASEFIDGFDTDSRSGVMEQPADASFAHDIDAFNALQTHDTGEQSFDGPSDDNVLAIDIDHRRLKQICILLRGPAWARVKGDWQWELFDYDDAETKPARALLPVLTKLERLYQATPKAPNLKEQNQFLRAHADMLRYYWHKITILVDHICTQRLEILEHGEPTDDARSLKLSISESFICYLSNPFA
ncbi:hypothetical protein ONZ43_g4326 [Nemania bipapillata]|uniref:Uncharacterized protein n=1 Tax=Nemania bipapillata TaxID=110536 RepID=A0ACC2IP59_9PEZI|nr:hypothetical protein ONZ43_g4326 [Nemania bipapillata]